MSSMCFMQVYKLDSPGKGQQGRLLGKTSIPVPADQLRESLNQQVGCLLILVLPLYDIPKFFGSIFCILFAILYVSSSMLGTIWDTIKLKPILKMF